MADDAPVNESAAPPEASAPPAPEPAPATESPPPEPAEPADPYVALKGRAAPWLPPIAGGPPCGVNARTDQRFDALSGEVGKQDSLEPKPVNWKLVVDDGTKFLLTVSKDLLVASYVTLGLWHTKKMDGLVTGTVLLTELLETYWEGVFPERPKGRGNALLFFLERIDKVLPENASPADRKVLDDLEVAARKFAEVARGKLDAHAPALGPYVQRIERLKMSLPEEAPPPPPPPPPGSAATPPPAPAPAPSAAPSAPAPTFTPPAASDLTGFLRSVGDAMADAAQAARQADAKDPAAYRALRVALYLHLAGPPPAGPGGKTSIPALADPRRDALAKMKANGKYIEALDESESALRTARFALDLHRISAECLAALGPEYQPARKALVAAVADLVRRMPELVTYQAGNGTPLADAQTQSWLEEEVAAAPAGGAGAGARSGGGESDDAVAAAVAEAKKSLADGKLEDALALLGKSAAGAASARARFQLRLTLAQTLANAGQPAVAKALFAELDRELVSRGLEEWDPALARGCLEGQIACLRTLARTAKGLVEPSAISVLYDRLCRLDPVAAMRVGPPS